MAMDLWSVDLILDARVDLGEGPCFDCRTGTLLWVDIMDGHVHQLDLDSMQDRVFAFDQPVGAVAPREQGGLVLALRDGFAVTDARGENLTWLARLDHEQPGMRLNDGACDSNGRFWAGTMHMDFTPGAGALYCLEPSGELSKVVKDISISNGIGWSPDDTVMYYVDTPTYSLDTFDFESKTGELGDRRSLAKISEDTGMPDGLAVDELGCIWVALWNGWSVFRYAPDGELIGVVEVPVERVTSCAFAGKDLDELFITTARPENEDGTQTHAGGLFRARPGVRGLPSHAFAG